MAKESRRKRTKKKRRKKGTAKVGLGEEGQCHDDENNEPPWDRRLFEERRCGAAASWTSPSCLPPPPLLPFPHFFFFFLLFLSPSPLPFLRTTKEEIEKKGKARSRVGIRPLLLPPLSSVWPYEWKRRRRTELVALAVCPPMRHFLPRSIGGRRWPFDPP